MRPSEASARAAACHARASRSIDFVASTRRARARDQPVPRAAHRTRRLGVPAARPSDAVDRSAREVTSEERQRTAARTALGAREPRTTSCSTQATSITTRASTPPWPRSARSRIVAGALRWLVASESSPDALLAIAGTRGHRVAHHARAAPHGRRCTDAVRTQRRISSVVPRRLEAGVSIKILEALAHGLPTVAVRTATGGFALEDACRARRRRREARSPHAIGDVLTEPFLRMALSAAGPAHLARDHGPRACLDALEER
jgi:hypothetical protein